MEYVGEYSIIFDFLLIIEIETLYFVNKQLYKEVTKYINQLGDLPKNYNLKILFSKKRIIIDYKPNNSYNYHFIGEIISKNEIFCYYNNTFARKIKFLENDEIRYHSPHVINNYNEIWTELYYQNDNRIFMFNKNASVIVRSIEEGVNVEILVGNKFLNINKIIKERN
jgi:hypothetical protein